MIVQDIMTRNPKYIEIDTSIRDAIQIMQEFDIRHLPVLEAGELVGILSDRDIRGLVLSVGSSNDAPSRMLQNLDIKVSQVMQSNPITVELDSDLSDAIELMVENKIGALPVIDAHDSKLQGILSYIDILKSITTTEDDRIQLSSVA